MRHVARLLLVAVLGTALAACGDPPPPPPPPPPPIEGRTPDPQPPVAAAPVRDAIAIPAGRLRVGSRPGVAGRRAEAEADLVAIELPAFTIDASPYPNRAGEPARTGVTRDEAAALCAAVGKRLCHELEWERACAGAQGAEYPTGASLDARCASDPARCATPEGVRGLGLGAAEWTASTADARFGDAGGRAIVRGSARADATLHRCAARRAIAPSEREGLGFRCCTGAEPSLAYPSEPARPTFTDAPLDLEHARAALRSVPELARYAEGFRFFSAGDRGLVLGRGNATQEALTTTGRTAMSHVLRWSPTRGEEVWVLVGQSGRSSLVAALHPLPDGSFVHGGSMILDGDPISVLVTYRRDLPDTLYWTSCWGCAGEGGQIERREDGRIVVTQQ